MSVLTTAQLGDMIFRAGQLVEGEKRHEEMGRVAVEYAKKRTQKLKAENDRFRAVLTKIAEMSKFGIYGDMARTALKGEKP